MRRINVFAHIGELDVGLKRGDLLWIDQRLTYFGFPGHARFQNNRFLVKGRW